MMKIQKSIGGEWTEFITIHSRGLGETYRVVSDELVTKKAVDTIRLAGEIQARFLAFLPPWNAVQKNRIKPVLDAMVESGHDDDFDDTERDFLAACTMLGYYSGVFFFLTIND